MTYRAAALHRSGPARSPLADPRRPASPPSQHVAEALVRHGRQTRRELYQSGIPLADLDLSLAVLIQQNLVNVYMSDAQREDERYLYEAALDRMLQIIRCGYLGLIQTAAWDFSNLGCAHVKVRRHLTSRRW